MSVTVALDPAVDQTAISMGARGAMAEGTALGRSEDVEALRSRARIEEVS